MQRAFSESVFVMVKQRESEFVETSTVCTAYAEIDDLTVHHDLVSVCIVVALRGFFEANCLETLHKS